MSEPTATREYNGIKFSIRTKYLKHYRTFINHHHPDANKEYLGLYRDDYRECIHIFHCDDGPAIKTQKFEEWIVMGKRHRTDGPAEEYPLDRESYWYSNGKRPRLDGPAIITPIIIEYYVYGKRHHTAGPARITRAGAHTGLHQWYYQDKLHRYEGPAVIKPITFEEYDNVDPYGWGPITYKPLTFEYEWWTLACDVVVKRKLNWVMTTIVVVCNRLIQ
jgi:hypothetical protein